MSDTPFTPPQPLLTSCAATSNPSSSLPPHDNPSSSTTISSSCTTLFRSYRAHYNLVPETDTSLEKRRYEKFVSNVIFLQSHNDAAVRTASYSHYVGLNKFSDRLDHERPLMSRVDWESAHNVTVDDRRSTVFQTLDLTEISGSDSDNFLWSRLEGMHQQGWKGVLKSHQHRKKISKKRGGGNVLSKLAMELSVAPESNALKKYLNWATSANPDGVSVVNPPQDQGACGSCWAFSATGSLEASVVRNTGFDAYSKAIGDELDTASSPDVVELAVAAAQSTERDALNRANLSVQELLDCDSSDDQGCAGGNPFYAYNFIHRFGLTSAVGYPYTAKMGVCQVDKVFRPIASVEAWGALPPNFELNMEIVLRYVGPIAVGLNGADPSFLHYKNGVYNSADCADTPNHAMLLVGYGEEPDSDNITQKYWIARNSWGTGWGEDGYVRVARGDGKKGHSGVCGIAQGPSVALGGFFVHTDHGVNNDHGVNFDMTEQAPNNTFVSLFPYSTTLIVVYASVMFISFLIGFYFVMERYARFKTRHRREDLDLDESQTLIQQSVVQYGTG